MFALSPLAPQTGSVSMKFSLVEVDRFPDTLGKEKLYWSKEFKITAHLCACGCGDVIYLPIGPTDYSIAVHDQGPTLRPSIGNWNVCNAHYFITNGEVQWARKWTSQQIAVARAQEGCSQRGLLRTAETVCFTNADWLGARRFASLGHGQAGIGQDFSRAADSAERVAGDFRDGCYRHEPTARQMSSLGNKRTLKHVRVTSALPRLADISTPE